MLLVRNYIIIYKQKQQDKEIELLLEKNSTLNQNNSQAATDTISYIHSTKNETPLGSEAAYSGCKSHLSRLSRM